MTTQPVALVTGASSGIGKAAALALVDRGFRVVGTSRDAARVTAPAGTTVFDLDVSRDQQPGKVEAKPRVTLFRAALKDGVLVEEGKTTLPDWSSLKSQLGGAQ